jgi:haloalkane dehalogenase
MSRSRSKEQLMARLYLAVLVAALGSLSSTRPAAANDAVGVTHFPLSKSRLVIRAGEAAGRRRIGLSGRWDGHLPAVDPTTQPSTVRVGGAAGEGSAGGIITLDPAKWTALPGGRGFRYRDAARGAGGIETVVLKAKRKGGGHLRLAGGKERWAYHIDALPTLVGAMLTIGDARWCAVFDAPKTRRDRIEARERRPPPDCPLEPGNDVLRTPDAAFAAIKDYPFSPHYVQAGRVRIHYIDEGPADADPVLLLHGEPSWSYLYRTMIPGLVAAGHRVIAPDLVGFGKSDKPAGLDDYTYQSHVDWIRRLMEALDLRNITLFAQDWGGLIGLRLVAEDTERFTRVVAANTFLPTGDVPLPPIFASFRTLFLDSAPIGLIVQLGTLTTLSPEVIAAYEAPFPDFSFKAGARMFPTLLPGTPDDPAADPNRRAWQVLRTLHKPFLTTFSDGDPLTAGLQVIFQTAVPGAQGQPHTTIVGAGHFLQEDKGPLLAELVNAFIAANP